MKNKYSIKVSDFLVFCHIKIVVDNKAEHAVLTYAAGVGGLGAWGLRALGLGPRGP